MTTTTGRARRRPRWQGRRTRAQGGSSYAGTWSAPSKSEHRSACGGATPIATGPQPDAGDAGQPPHPDAGPLGDSGPHGDSGSTNRFPCRDPKAIVIAGKDTGFDTCADGATRRRVAVDCPTV